MKVAQHTKYNKNNIALNITEVPRPTMNENQVLIKVSAAGVNPLDNICLLYTSSGASTHHKDRQSSD